MRACFAAAALTLLSSVTAGQAALNGTLTLRPLTPQETTDYGLTGAQVSGGLTTIGLGQPAYLEAQVNIASNDTSVVWTLTSKPDGSTATILPSPLGTNVPVYKVADRSVYRVAGRAFLRPDVVGPYTVSAVITTPSGDSNSVSINITGATYMGIQVCASCHSGAFPNVPNIYSGYTNTAHSYAFKEAINGISTGHFSANCISCHVLGYDTNTNANNGGFDDVAKALNWSFPSSITSSNWDMMPSQLQNVANIQCENCHGPGSQHIYSQGVTGNTNAISVTYSAGDCSQCHDSLTHHIKSAEWNASMHASPTRSPSGAGRESCVGCHTGPGFIGRMAGWDYTNSVYEAITCQACHDPHNADPTTNPEQLRVKLTDSVAFEDGSIVTNGGNGKLCMECHHARVDAKTYASDPNNASSHFGPHHGPQGDMLEGVNGYTYDQDIPSSSHSKAVPDTCVTCHMQAVAASDPAFAQAGGHTFNVSWSGGDLVTACQQCHGSAVTSFDIALKDYDGDGVVDGVQTEVQHLLDKLSTLLPNSSGVLDGLVKTPSPAKTWSASQVEAAYNYTFVEEDGSMGIHNTAYTVGLLKASIADLIGKPYYDGADTNDIAYYAWQKQYFGSATAPEAAPDYVNNASGIPNWMMFNLGLDPTSNAQAANNGVIYFNGKNIVNGTTNSIAIYTAAEVAFDTEVGFNYQVQGISELSGTWSNLSTNIPGTGGTISYVTPTRNDAQMFFRVVKTQ